MKSQSTAFFENSHKSMLEDLHTMLENEMWQRCPLNKDFTILGIFIFLIYI